MMTRKRYIFLVLLLGALTALGPLSVDMYLPGFPAIAAGFHISTARVSLSLSSFFLGISLGQLVYGPLLERYGRKPPLYTGLLIYVAASAGCYFSGSIENLIAFRFIQAIGSCAAGVVSMTMVRDIFPVKDNAKIFGLLLLVLGASPMIAPTIGGFISSAFGWQAIFIVLGLVTVAILAAVFFGLPETHPADPTHSLKPKHITKSFLSVFRQPQFVTYSLGGSIALSGLFTYIADSPMIFMEGYGVSNHTYGWIFAILAVGFIGSSQFNGLLSRKFSAEQIVNGSITCMAIISIIFLIGSVYNWFGLVGTAVMIFGFLCCIGIANPNTAALSMAPFEKNAGSAASLFGVIQWGVAGISSVAVSLFKSHNSLPLSVTMTSTALVTLLVLFIGRKSITRKIAVGNEVNMMH